MEETQAPVTAMISTQSMGSKTIRRLEQVTQQNPLDIQLRDGPCFFFLMLALPHRPASNAPRSTNVDHESVK